MEQKMGKKETRGREQREEKPEVRVAKPAKIHPASGLFFSLALLLSGGLLFLIYQPTIFGYSSPPALTPVPSISYMFDNHIHGLGYDSQNQRLFVATHYGLFVWKDGKLFQLGRNRDDFMGFSLHPTNPNIIYTSGHPEKGGNMGVTKSEDGGVSFKRIFEGLEGKTVDFHSMTISPAKPSILYGSFLGRLYRSKDGGKNWQFALGRGLPEHGFCWGAPCLSADSKDAKVVYAGAPNGLLISHDFGENWIPLNSELGAVAGVGVDPSDSKRWFAFTQKFGLAASRDGGKDWQARNSGIKLSRQEFVFAFAFDRKNSSHLFAATGEQILRSTDGGESWEKIL